VSAIFLKEWSTITQLALLILCFVFILIAIRQVGGFSFQIWQVMLAGAVLTVLCGQISPFNAVYAINPGVMVFLLGMFIVGEGVKTSGILIGCMTWICTHARSGDILLSLLIISTGLLSAVLMNDTIAITGAPLVIILAERFGVSKPGALLALCFSVTTGSVFSPIGNPQNYLIATYIPELSPYPLFIAGLFIPTLLSLGVVFVFLRPLFRNATVAGSECIMPDTNDKMKKWPVYVSFSLIITGVALHIIDGLSGTGWVVPVQWVAIAAAVPVIICSNSRIRLLKNIDWCTIVFFCAMFVLMQSVYDTGYFQNIVPETGNSDIFLVLVSGTLLSQLISNVPFVALFQPVLLSPGVSPSIILALAAGSTIAGNLTILGAASNVIIIQQAEKQGVHIPMTFFCRYGIPVTLCQIGIYAIYLIYLPFIGT